MKHLLHILEGRLEALPVRMAVQLPAGLRLGAHNAAVTLRVSDRMALVALASGEIGSVGAAIVEGRVALEGTMRELMAAAAGLLAGNPAQDSHRLEAIAEAQKLKAEVDSLMTQTLKAIADFRFVFDTAKAKSDTFNELINSSMDAIKKFNK
jgi:hypothetical protein